MNPLWFAVYDSISYNMTSWEADEVALIRVVAFHLDAT